MNSDDLTTEQAGQIADRVTAMLGYLTRLRERMDKRGFEPQDSFYRAVADAHHAVHCLSVRAHYLSCKSGVGRKERI